MPGRPSKRDDDRDDPRRGSGVVPAGAIAMLLAISGVFVYGIFLKAAGPSESENPSGSPHAPAPGDARPSASPKGSTPSTRPPVQIAAADADEAATRTADTGSSGEILPPIIPEATTAGTLGGVGFGSGGGSVAPGTSSSTSSSLGRPPLTPTPASPGVTPPAPASARATSPAATASKLSAGAAAAPGAKPAVASTPKTGLAQGPRTASNTRTAGAAGSRAAPRSSEPVAPPERTRHDEPPAAPREPVASASHARIEDATERDETPAGAAASNPSHLALAPRGAAPAVTLKKAREQFSAKKYKDAARSWSDWAQRTPPGSWTVQIAAIKLDKAASAGKLDSLGGRDGAFVLPGTLAGGLSPVCVGVYPSEEAARRAAAAMAPLSGSSSRPIAKPLSSLAN